MKTTLTLSLVAILFMPYLLHAQKIKVISATHAGWSGGAAGHHGDNYVFTIEFSDYKTEPVPDTVWVGNDVVQVVLTNNDPSQSVNTKVSRIKRSLRFEISARVAHDDYADRYPSQGQEKKVQPHAPIKYSGVALLTYKYNGKRQHFTIPKITTEYPHANYP
ncbi:MAG: hypothetical protein JWQ38_2572 [Flavipsychrobacter sp.]|nr:hypothetical protein [Flavipsychrobacter sp.]